MAPDKVGETQVNEQQQQERKEATSSTAPITETIIVQEKNANGEHHDNKKPSVRQVPIKFAKFSLRGKEIVYPMWRLKDKIPHTSPLWGPLFAELSEESAEPITPTTSPAKNRGNESPHSYSSAIMFIGDETNDKAFTCRRVFIDRSPDAFHDVLNIISGYPISHQCSRTQLYDELKFYGLESRLAREFFCSIHRINIKEVDLRCNFTRFSDTVVGVRRGSPESMIIKDIISPDSFLSESNSKRFYIITLDQYKRAVSLFVSHGFLMPKMTQEEIVFPVIPLQLFIAPSSE